MGHEQAILAHLYRMFGGGHGASGAGAIQTARNGRRDDGGGTLVGSISAGAAAKGAAVIAIVVVAVGIRSDSRSRKHHPAPPRPAAVRPTPAVAAPARRTNPMLTYPPRNALPRRRTRRRRTGSQGDRPRSPSRPSAPTQYRATPVAGQRGGERVRNRTVGARRPHSRISGPRRHPGLGAAAPNRWKQRNASSAQNGRSVAAPRPMVARGENLVKPLRGKPRSHSTPFQNRPGGVVARPLTIRESV